MYRISTLHELGGSCTGLSDWVRGREHDHDFETVNGTKSKQLLKVCFDEVTFKAQLIPDLHPKTHKFCPLN